MINTAAGLKMARFDFCHHGVEHGDFCCFKGATYVAVTLCCKLRSFLHTQKLRLSVVNVREVNVSWSTCACGVTWWQ